MTTRLRRRGDLEDPIHVGHLAVEMDRDDCPGVRSHRGLDELRVDGKGVRIDVDEDGTAAT